ncbi:non-ribosomal peptide synthetase [Micromonospora peucetia]|uniref:Amino acid adenylation domain-containing protein n=1 Tax=Micromonospora peucetia TaxID=47871 RepID=A0ABZ1EJA9_9ACTN|nr:non-ribosomal peptide synthetase [Micromonospora peucetia]WSA34338.1 amino acid adenylation domain-containing protein [Micromonospora peucetia]
MSPADEETLTSPADEEPFPSPADVGLFSLISAAGRRDPELAAIRSGDESVSYARLLTTASWLAGRLRAAGVGPGDVVAVCAGRSTEYLLGLLAALAADAVFLPIDPDTPPGRVAAVLGEAAPAAVLRVPTFPLPATTTPVIDLDWAAAPADVPVARPMAHGDDPAYLIYTSGSTGTPKGVLCHHRGISNLLTDFATRQPLAPGAVGTMWSSVGFDASVYEIFSVLLAGGTLLVVPDDVRLEPAAMFALMARHAVATAYLPPAILPSLRAWVDAHPGALTLRRLMVGVEPIPERLLHGIAAAVPGLKIVNAYGPTEAHVIATAYDITGDGPEPDDGRTPIGMAVRGVTTHVLDPDGRPVVAGQVGELWVGGVQVALGYHRRPELTRERFVPDPFDTARSARLYRTGDLVRRRSDGNLVYCGRVDRQIKLRGFRVEPAEVEAVLERHPGVAGAVVVQPESAAETLCAYVTGAGTTESLLAHARELLPDYMVPNWVVFVAEFPLTANEKLDRAALARRSPPIAPTGDNAPQTPTEAALARLWAEVLGVETIDVAADFTALGGHSLAAVRLGGRIRRDFGVALTVADVYRHRTVSAVAAAIDAQATTAPTPGAARPSRRIGPLSTAQQALLLLHRLYPNCQAYTLAALHRLTGDLDVAVLSAALDLLVERHSALRTVITTVADRDVLRVVDHEPIDLLLVTVSEAELTTRCEAEVAAADFDLAGGRLFRAVLFRTGPDQHALLLLAHHIITDGWSFTVIQRDLGLAYEAVQAGRPPAWEPLPAQFIDLAAEQQAAGYQETVTAELDFWRRELASIPEPLRLPVQRLRPARPRFRGGRVTAPVPASTMDAVRELARALHTTVFAVLVTCVQVIVARYSGRHEFLLGMPVAGRDDLRAEDLVGFFNNSLPLRCEVADDATVAELTAATHERLMAALAHPHVPFDVLVREVNAPRTPGANPLFQMWCNMLSYPPAPLRLPGCVVEPLPVPLAGALFDLSWYFVEDGAGLNIEVVYDAELFEADHAQAMADHLCTLLPLAASVPDGAISDLDFGVHDPGRTPRHFIVPGPRVVERFRQAVSRRGAAPAIGDAYSYAELDAAVTDLAAGWRGKGPVGIVAGRTPALPVGVLAALTAGVPFVLLDASQPFARLRRMIAQAQVGQWWDATDGQYPELVGQLSGCDRGTGADVADGTAYVAFTSGTTGAPAAIAAGEEPLQAFLEWYVPQFALTASDRFVLLSGIGHDPLLRDVLTPLSIGARLFVPPPVASESQVAMVRWLAGIEPTVLHLTPALGRLLSAAAIVEGVTLPSVRLVGFGGAAMTPAGTADARALFPQARLMSYYGTTETPQVVSVADLGAGVGVGSGGPTAQVSVATPSGGPAPVNGTGEIVVRGPYLALGYLGDPARTARQFRLRDGVREYRTGDLGHTRPDGSVVITGRADRQITVNGLRVEPAELELVAREHSLVRDCVVTTAVRSSSTEVVAFVEGDPGALPSDAVIRHFAQRLPDTMVPSRVVVMPAIPLTPNGKPDLARLAEIAKTVTTTPTASAKGTDALVATITQVWSTVLGMRPAGPEVNFFDCGGTSAGLLKVQTELSRRLSREVALLDLFRYPTIAGLAAALAS